MSMRYDTIKSIGKRTRFFDKSKNEKLSKYFSKNVFCEKAMKKYLPENVCNNILNAIIGMEKIDLKYADQIADAMKTWAMDHNATHFTHWFHPMTGGTIAEKHDSFLVLDKKNKLIEKLSGKQLLQGEPDASSFPSGGLRSTYEARGYTIWDPSSPPFIWEGGDGYTLCIPSVFFSYKGDVLDNKIPLLRSEYKINVAAKKLLKLFKIDVDYVYPTLGIEQEYFVINRELRNLRSDLVMLDKTVFGAPPSKGQELEDQYFGSIKDKILAYMKEVEREALKIGIPIKTHHNEVAPAQHEAASFFEKSSLSVDHNILLMELMKQIAIKHDLACILNEKPFEYINGSGKHNNWSLATDAGLNLLNPKENVENNSYFLVLLTAVIHAIFEHSKLLRASIGSPGNDYRLGGSEAPPAIISVYLGDQLEEILNSIEDGKPLKKYDKNIFDLNIFHLPKLPKDNTDRNRTSFFAFTGDKFEFRAVGSSCNCAFPATVINTIVADSLTQILDDIDAQIEDATGEEIAKITLNILKKYLQISKKIRFSGDNYSDNWKREAESRDLPNIKKSFFSYSALLEGKTIKVFKNLLTKEELKSRYDVLTEYYSKILDIESNLMIDIFKTQILPAAIKQQNSLAKSINLLKEINLDTENFQFEYLKKFSKLISDAICAFNDLKDDKNRIFKLSHEERAKNYCDTIINKMKNFRILVDNLETYVDDTIWPLPKYRELLFLI